MIASPSHSNLPPLKSLASAYRSSKLIAKQTTTHSASVERYKISKTRSKLNTISQQLFKELQNVASQIDLRCNKQKSRTYCPAYPLKRSGQPPVKLSQGRILWRKGYQDFQHQSSKQRRRNLSRKKVLGDLKPLNSLNLSLL